MGVGGGVGVGIGVGVCVAGVLTGNTDREIHNHLLGGDLVLRWDEATNHVHMTGPAREVFTGEWKI